MIRNTLFALLLLLPASLLASAGQGSPSILNVGFYYGLEAPIGSLYAYDWLVLQPTQTSDARLDFLNLGNTRPIAYLSAGEMAHSDQAIKTLGKGWVLGENTAWKSYVLDIRRADVRAFMLDDVVTPAMTRGFRGVFLDTLDSHLLTEEGKNNQQAFADAQALLIAKIRERFPESRIIINRGFHLPEQIHQQVDALAFESWRNGYEAGGRRYYRTSEQDREWLSGQLSHWRENHPNTPIIAIDYAKSGAEAVELSQQLAQEGFTPYVSDHDLNRLGPTLPPIKKRHILVFHDLPEHQADQSSAHRRLGILLERLGLVPTYRSILQPFLNEPLDDRYLGAVVWRETNANASAFCRWLGQSQSTGFPVVVFGLSPTSTPCKALIQSRRLAVPAGSLEPAAAHPSMGNFESKRLPTGTLTPLPQPRFASSWLTVADSSSNNFTPVYTHPTGGVAIAPFIFEMGPDDQAYWRFDPFGFLKEALKLDDFPAIDSTTESGRRILTAHIDGDGLVSRAELPGSPLGSEAIQERILKVFDIPHTISVIEAETSPQGLFPTVSQEAEASARDILRMENIEVASHSYSHPFFWQMVEGGAAMAPDPEDTLYGYSMDVPGYTPSLTREIDSSVAYINERLAPKDKPVSVFLWTGDARPGPEALKATRKLGLVNVNGGDTRPLPYASELAGVWPDARPVGDELQVYAATMNENVYTNLWTGPFYGFRNVVDTFKILEAHNRLKPISIYYHFYSGTKPEALKALKEVYQYALSQPVTPLYLSDYAKRVQGQYYSALLQQSENSYRWRGIRPPSTVRISQNQYPDMDHSEGVAGFHDTRNLRFVHLTGDNPLLVLSSNRPTGPLLDSANAQIVSWQRNQRDDNWKVQLELKGYQPLEFVLTGTSHCSMEGTQLSISKKPEGFVQFSAKTQHSGRFELECD
ncbi:endo alpha-1,4 polygalactosaminidase [uncultured Marinobacter sp.]|uniref:endo alpha-1,4 polygalactosaminidase n=1 Tax=uncultured Marinobacter sp. TaxID=187379 RepID=UPI00262D6BAD|nr:endo alpha-1,4 polygalactosaminidase [uncultured Marinobacter sp.]